MKKRTGLESSTSLGTMSVREDGVLLSSPAVRVLVIEDDDFMRETLRMMLQAINDKSAAQGSQLHIPALNLSIEYAASGEQAWDMMRVKQFDIAFVDLSLPGVSGLDLSWCVKQLPQDDDGHSAPHSADATILIACTGDEQAAKRFAEYGLHDVLPKPVSISQLRHMIHKWLPRVPSASQHLPQLEEPLSLQRNCSGVFAGRVLLVEDDMITRSASDLVFQHVGLCADIAADGESAMEMLRRRDYDLLLLVRPLRCCCWSVAVAPDVAASAAPPHIRCC